MSRLNKAQLSFLNKVHPVIFWEQNGRFSDDCPPYWGRFVLATVSVVGDSKIILRSRAGESWSHQSIRAKLLNEPAVAQGQLAVTFLGGGTLSVHTPSGNLWVGGTDAAFGTDYTVAQRLLQEALPTWGIEIHPELE